MLLNLMKRNLRTTLYIAIVLTVVTAFTFGQGTVDRAVEKSKSTGENAGIIRSAWDSIAFWKKEKAVARLHYLPVSPPMPLELGDSFPQWDESAEFAARPKKVLPITPHEVVRGAPSYSNFLNMLKEAEASEADLDKTEEEGAELGDAVVDSPSESNEPELGSSDFDSGSGVSEFEVDDYSHIEAVFPRPYEQFVSGERLLMFFPVGDLPSNNSEISRILLPVESSIFFQPPSVNSARSSVTMRNEN